MHWSGSYKKSITGVTPPENRAYFTNTVCHPSDSLENNIGQLALEIPVDNQHFFNTAFSKWTFADFYSRNFW